MFRTMLLTLAVCAAALYLAQGEAQAQRGHGGGRGGGGGHAGVAHGHHGGFGHYGRHGGYGRYGYGGFGLGFYGLGYGLGYGYRYGYAPGYYAYSPYDYGYAPAYGYGSAPDYGYVPSTADVYPAPGYSAGPTVSSGYYSPPGGEAAREPGSVQIEVRVPPGAEVFFDGVKSSQTGPNRLYSTPAVDRGKPYRYEVTARWREGGRNVERKQTVRFKGGEAGPVVVDFTRAGGEGRSE